MKKLPLLFACAAIAATTGCQNTVNTVENRDKSMQPNYIRSKYVSTDSFVRNRLKVVNINRSTLPSGLLMIQVTLLSQRVGFLSETWSDITGDNPYKIAYKFDWLDKDGMEVTTAASTWTEMDLIPGETRRIQAVAPNIRCKDFVLGLKEYGK